MSDRDSTTSSVEYRLIPDYPAYRVGSDGSVWSSRVQGGWKSGVPVHWRRMKPTKYHNGYLGVHLTNSQGQKTKKVHILVMLAFHGEPPEGMQVCHFPDPDPANNRLENLRYGTAKDNAAQRLIHGKTTMGERVPAAKLKEADIRPIREMYAGGMTQQEIARRYKVTGSAISRVVRGEYWKHVL